MTDTTQPPLGAAANLLGSLLSTTPTARPLWAIAAEIETDWTALGNGVNYAARPYLDAMKALDTMADSYYAESADSIVRYFLANAGTWRGEGARRLKNELKGMLK